jgi:hypothetical protein
MKLRYIIKWAILIILVVVFAIVFFQTLHDQSASSEVGKKRPSQQPLLPMNLKDVIFLDWDKNISEISKSLPGGRLTQRKSDGLEMNVYWIDAILADIDSNAKISFQRNENKSGQFVTHRSIQLTANSTDEIENMYGQIISTLPSYGRKIINFGKSEYMDSTFQLEDVDGSGGFQLDFRKDLKSMAIRIDITRYKIITKQ